MKGKRLKNIITFLFSVCITFGTAGMVYAANDTIQTSDGLSLMTYEEYQAAMEHADEQVQTAKSSVDSFDSNEYFSKTDKRLPLSKENLSLVSAEENIKGIVRQSEVEADVNGIVPFAAPQSGITPRVLNPETLKGGEITTDTQIVWFVDFFDADGDTLLDYSIGGFPLSYVVDGMLYQDGFITQFVDPGSFSVSYQAIDSNGELGDVETWSLEVVPVEDYLVIEDSLNNASDKKTYTVDIDFDKMDAAAFALIKSSDTQPRITITDEAGTAVKMYGNETKRWGYAEKPEGKGICTYTISVYCSHEEDYVDGSSGFRVLYGDKKDTEAILSGPENAARLEKFTNVKDNFIQTGYTPNRDWNYYRFRADGPTVFTMLTYYPELRFQIRDTVNLFVMYDSDSAENDDVHKTKFIQGWAGAEKARINTVAGEEYYLVLYTPTQISTLPMVEKTINLAVGLPHMASEQTGWYYGNSITANSSSYSSISYVEIGDNGGTVPETAFVRQVQWAGTSASNIKYFRVREPGGSSWRNSAMYDIALNLGYVTDSNSNIKLNGTWQLGFQASSNTVTFVPQFKAYYYYELGD